MKIVQLVNVLNKENRFQFHWIGQFYEYRYNEISESNEATYVSYSIRSLCIFLSSTNEVCEC